MYQAQGYADDLINQAEVLLAKIEAGFAATAALYQAIGVDPTNTDGAFGLPLGLRQRAELAKILAADRVAIDQEVAEETARLRMSSPAPATARKRLRNLI